MNDVKETVKKRIHLLLKKHNITQKELAEKSGLTAAIINKAVVKGELSINSALQISAALDISLDYIYGNTEVDSYKQYAFDIIEKHIHGAIIKSMWGDDIAVSGLVISKALAQYLYGCNEAKGSKGLFDDIRNQWIGRLADAFMKVIDVTPTETCKVVLIEPELYTSEVHAQIENAKREINK